MRKYHTYNVKIRAVDTKASVKQTLAVYGTRVKFRKSYSNIVEEQPQTIPLPKRNYTSDCKAMPPAPVLYHEHPHRSARARVVNGRSWAGISPITRPEIATGTKDIILGKIYM